MSWQTFVLGLAPYLVTLVGVLLAAFWGKQVLAAKDAQLQAKEEQLNTLKMMAPERVVENIRALHAYYKEESDVTKSKLHDATNRLTDAGSEREELVAEVQRLRERLEVFEFASASTASAVITGTPLTDAYLTTMYEHMAQKMARRLEAFETLETAGIDEIGRPTYTVEGRVVTEGEAERYLVAQGLLDDYDV